MTSHVFDFLRRTENHIYSSDIDRFFHSIIVFDIVFLHKPFLSDINTGVGFFIR